MQKKGKGKELYNYQQEDLDKIFERINNCPANYNLLYQLPTGGGKTVIFSEIARRFIEMKQQKVMILTHRIELCNQTSKMLAEFGVKNKIINSAVKELPDQDEYECFVAMVETLNNRLQDDKVEVNDIGLVIIDEAHYNSFRKLFKYFDECFILGVTATPLSSNIKLPMRDIYKELITGKTISSLVEDGFLSKATTYSFDVSLRSLKIGINGDYTVKSSEMLYTDASMQSKLLYAYRQKGLGKKTLIFNNGIYTSQYVYHTFKTAGYKIRHLDNTTKKKDRKAILQWFKETPDAILTSVGLLTTGFDEPSIKTIILNRATRSLTLYYQMIGRGSRVFLDGHTFDVIDLGNNAARFGLWSGEIDWQKIFKHPSYYLENMISDDEIERKFKYEMPEDLRAKFAKSKNVDFDIEKENDRIKAEGSRSFAIIDSAIEQHAVIILENSDDLMTALSLSRELEEDISDRVRRYCYIICKSTKNYRVWVEDEYMKKLRAKVMGAF